jgi:hypothetical protein
VTITVGETIAVLGAGVYEPDHTAAPSEGYRGVIAMRLRLSSTPHYPLRVSDYHWTTV